MKLRSLSLLTGIVSDIVLWIVLFSLVGGLSLIIISTGKKSGQANGQIITLYFNDANQLTQGSPVNFMGTDVGYVTSVKPLKDQVEVKFQTYVENITFPKGTRFTIEFNGLAGAKTLEALPPGKIEQTEEYYISENPVRIKDVINTQMILAKALEFSAENTAHTLGNIQGEETLLKKLEFFQYRLTSINRTLVYAFESAQNQANRIHSAVKDAESFINSFNSAVKELEYIISPDFFKTNAMTSLRQVSAATENIYRGFVEVQKHERIDAFHNKIDLANRDIKRFKQVIENHLAVMLHPLAQFNQTLDSFNRFLCRIEQDGVYNKISLDSLAKCKDKTACWAEKTKKWANKMNPVSSGR